VEVDDLIADGMLGPVDAIRRFDATKWAKFEAMRGTVPGAILDGLRGADPASRDLRRKTKQSNNSIVELEIKLGRPARTKTWRALE